MIAGPQVCVHVGAATPQVLHERTRWQPLLDQAQRAT
jgi:hypothetical protein